MGGSLRDFSVQKCSDLCEGMVGLTNQPAEDDLSVETFWFSRLIETLEVKKIYGVSSPAHRIIFS